MFALTKDLAAHSHIAHGARRRRAPWAAATVPISPSGHNRPTVLVPLTSPHVSLKPELSEALTKAQLSNLIYDPSTIYQ